ncbi:MAG: electron transfer flavoprotein subunit alpha/FixB family protein [Actinobacteria bacterium]|nr:electron transfer flavoprotein subunit alpha/FixB family protein [Actinomycetota bacterium]
MSDGVLVAGEVTRQGLRPGTAELIAAGVKLKEEGAGSLTVALIDVEADAHVDAVNLAGVDEVLTIGAVPERFEAHVAQAALETLIEQRRPRIVLAGHTFASLGFMPAVAARGSHGFASDATAVSCGPDGIRARRGAYGDRLVAELEFPGKDTVVVLLREGAFEPAEGAGSAAVEAVALEIADRARTERIELRDPPAGDVDITAADFLLAIGRGVEEEEQVAEFEELAGRMGATLSASRPLVDAGWISRDRQVGQSGTTVTPKVYLALGISGAVQHLAGMSKAKTIIAVNSDADAPIFSVAHYGAVADLYEVADELRRQFDE